MLQVYVRKWVRIWFYMILLWAYLGDRICKSVWVNLRIIRPLHILWTNFMGTNFGDAYKTVHNQSTNHHSGCIQIMLSSRTQLPAQYSVAMHYIRATPNITFATLVGVLSKGLMTQPDPIKLLMGVLSKGLINLWHKKSIYKHVALSPWKTENQYVNI